MTNRDRPLRRGFDITPNRLWTLDLGSPKTNLLLGWLHSHADDYLQRLSLARIGREFGGGRASIKRCLDRLEAAGFVRVDHGPDGIAATVVMLSEAWEDLHQDGSGTCTTMGQGVTHDGSGGVTHDGSPEKNTPRTPDVEHHASSLPNRSDRFDEFWDQYPRRVAKKDAAKAWAQMTPTDRAHALVAIPHHIALWRAEGRGTRTVPYPATWLRRESWEDELQHIPERTTTQGSVMDRIRAANQTVRSTP